MPNQLSSTAQDLARGRASEIGHLNGHVIRRGAVHGIATPATRTLLTLVKAIESRDAARVA
jgi:2-dehydropantoate 2-reductase